MCTDIFLSRPSWRPVLQFSQHVMSSGFPWNDPMLAHCFTARKPQNNQFIWLETPFNMLLADWTDCFTRLFYLSHFRARRLFHTWINTLFFYAVTATAPCQDASAILSYSRIPWFDTLWLPIVTQAKLHVPVNRVLNLHNGRNMAPGPRHSARLLLFILVAKKFSL